MSAGQRSGWAAPAVVAGGLLLGTGLALWLGEAPVSDRDPEISVARAREHLERIAAVPRPLGSPAHARARRYLADELTRSGFEVELQDVTLAVSSWGAYRHNVNAARVVNVAGRLRGSGSGRAVALVTHYDSVPGSPGAGDSGAAVAALLEVARTLAAGGPLRNDLVILFTDGEEAGLFGAQAFVDHHPWSEEVGVLVNFDARGRGGAPLLIETSRSNLALVRTVAAAVPRPHGSSLAARVYDLLPNKTDFTTFRRAGMTGLNFAFIEGAVVYHTSRDTLERLDPETLRLLAATGLALGRAFADYDLAAPPAGEAVFFDLLGRVMVVYPAGWALPLALVAVLLYGVLVWIGRRRGTVDRRGLVAGALAAAGGLVLAPLAVAIALWIARRLDDSLTAMPFGPTYNASVYHAAVVAVAVAATAGLYGRVLRRAGLAAATLGALGVVLAVLVALAVALPAGSYLLTWPWLAAAAAAAVLVWRGAPPGALVAVALAVAALPALALFVPWIELLLVGVTVHLAAAAAPFVALLLALLMPHLLLLSQRRWWAPAAVAALAAAGFGLAAVAGGDFGAERPRPDTLFYALDTDAATARWASPDPRPDAWTSRYLGGSPDSEPLPGFTGWQTVEYLTAPAPVVDYPASEITLVDDAPSAGGRVVRLLVRPAAGALAQRIDLPAAASVDALTVAGRRLDNLRPGAAEAAPEEVRLHYFGAAGEGFELVLEAGEGPVEINLVDYFPGLPPLGEPRPAGFMPGPVLFSDTALVRREYRF